MYIQIEQLKTLLKYRVQHFYDHLTKFILDFFPKVFLLDDSTFINGFSADFLNDDGTCRFQCAYYWQLFVFRGFILSRFDFVI